MRIGRAIGATLLAALVALAASGCGQGGDGDAAKPGSGATSSTTPTGKTVSLQLGKPLSADGVTTTIEQVKRDFTNGERDYAPSNHSLQWLGVRARTCVAADADPGGASGWFQFTAVDARGNWYPALTWSGDYPLPSTEWPLPRYPSYGEVPSGSCAAGWLLIAVPKTAKISQVVFVTADGQGQAAWQLP